MGMGTSPWLVAAVGQPGSVHVLARNRQPLATPANNHGMGVSTARRLDVVAFALAGLAAIAAGLAVATLPAAAILEAVGALALFALAVSVPHVALTLWLSMFVVVPFGINVDVGLGAPISVQLLATNA